MPLSGVSLLLEPHCRSVLFQADSARHTRDHQTPKKKILATTISTSPGINRIPFVPGSIPTGPGDFRDWETNETVFGDSTRLDSTHFRFRLITYIRTDTTVYEDGSYVVYTMYVRSRFMYRKRKLSVFTSVTYWNNVRIYPFQSYGIATKGRRLSAMLCDLSLSLPLSPCQLALTGM